MIVTGAGQIGLAIARRMGQGRKVVDDGGSFSGRGVYCAKVCSADMGISGTFTAMNALTLYGDLTAARRRESWLVGGHGRKSASECVRCGRCEQACPQHIAIRDELAKAAVFA